MADVLKALFQAYPAAGTLTDAYTAPDQAAVSSVAVCNQGSDKATFRISVAVAGAADEAKQYVYHDADVLGHDTFVATIGVTLAATDVVRVMSSSGFVSFNGFGVEVS